MLLTGRAERCNSCEIQVCRLYAVGMVIRKGGTTGLRKEEAHLQRTTAASSSSQLLAKQVRCKQATFNPRKPKEQKNPSPSGRAIHQGSQETVTRASQVAWPVKSLLSW